MAFFEITGQALRDFDAQRAAGLNPKPKPQQPGMMMAQPKPAITYGSQPKAPTYGLKGFPATAGMSPAADPRWTEERHQWWDATNKPAQFEGAANGRTANFDPGQQGGRSLASSAPMSAMSAASYQDPGAQQVYDSAYQGLLGTPFMTAEMAAQIADAQARAYLDQQGKATPQQMSDQAARQAIDNPFRKLAPVDWAGINRTMRGKMLADIGESREAQEKAARVDAARRGLMAGGNSRVAEGQQARIRENAAMAAQRGGQAIDMDLANQARDYDFRRAAAEGAFDQGAPGALAAALMIPGNLGTTNLQNQGLMLANQFAERTMDPRVQTVQLTADAQALENQFQGATMGDRIKSIATAYRLNEAQASQAEHLAKNQGWYAALNFLASIIPGLAKAAATGGAA